MTYSGNILATSGLVSYWRLGESSGTTAQDETANNNDGTIRNAPTLGATGLLTGDADTAITFNGTDEDIIFSNSLFQFPNTDPWTFEAWVTVPSSKAGYPTIMGRRENISGSNRGFLFYFDASGPLTVIRYSAGGNTQTALDAAYNPGAGTVIHAVATYDGANLKLYANGSLKATSADTGNNADTVVPFAIGSNSGTGSFFGGKIDEVAIYNVALSLATIQAHHAAGTASAHPLTAAIAASSTVAASRISLDQPLTGSIAGTWSVLASSIAIDQPLAGTVAGSSTTEAANLIVGHDLAGTVAGSSAVTATQIITSHPLTATVSGASEAGATEITVTHVLVSAVTGASIVTGELAAPVGSHPLTGSIAATSSANATQISLDQPLDGVVTGTSDMTGLRLMISHPLAATVAGASASAADRLILSHPLMAYVAGTSSVVGLISMSHPLTATVAGTSQVAGVLMLLGEGFGSATRVPIVAVTATRTQEPMPVGATRTPIVAVRATRTQEV